MYVYLARSGGRVDLPLAVSVEANSLDASEVRFLDAEERVIAVFRRADVVVHSDRDLGDTLATAPDQGEQSRV